MKRSLALLLPLALAACQDDGMPVSGALEPGGVPAALSLAQGVEQVMPGEVIVKARAGQDVAAIARGHGAEVAAVGYRGAFSVVRGAAGNERALAARLGADARVEYAEPNYLRQPTAIDPRLWAYFNDGSGRMFFSAGRRRGGVVATKLPVRDADGDNIEGYGAGGAPVVIGSIDTGVDLDHPEFLSGQLIAGRDWYNDDASPDDDTGHGTSTAGTMAGRTVGIAGVAGAGANVRVLVQKVCGRRGCPSSAIVNAIRAAADYPGMVAINLSLGGASESRAERAAINYAVRTKGVLVIAPAGNDGVAKVACPACNPLSISVAATTWSDRLADYSNWGLGLDIAAPGGEIYSNTSSAGGIYSSGLDGYGYFEGTSMAAPQVTGVAAVVASRTGLRGAALRARLEATTDDRGAPGYDTTFGHGRLNAYRAVTDSSLASGL